MGRTPQLFRSVLKNKPALYFPLLTPPTRSLNPPLSCSWKNIDLRPDVRDHRDLIGAVSRCVRQPRRPSKLPQNHSQRSLKTETGSNQLCRGLSPYSGIL